MAPLGMAPRRPEQSRDRVCGDVAPTGGGPHPTSRPQRSDDGRCPFLGARGLAQRGAASFGALRTARPAAPEPAVVLSVDLAHGQMVLTREAKPWACRLDTR